MTRRQRRARGRRDGGAEGRRCLAPGCELRVQPGQALCREHRRSPDGREVQRAVARLLDDLGRETTGPFAQGAPGGPREGGTARERVGGSERRAEAF